MYLSVFLLLILYIIWVPHPFSRQFCLYLFGGFLFLYFFLKINQVYLLTVLKGLKHRLAAGKQYFDTYKSSFKWWSFEMPCMYISGLKFTPNFPSVIACFYLLCILRYTGNIFITRITWFIFNMGNHAGAKIPNISILLPVEQSHIQTPTGEKTIKIAGR